MHSFELYIFLTSATLIFSGILYIDYQIREHIRAFSEGLLDGITEELENQ